MAESKDKVYTLIELQRVLKKRHKDFCHEYIVEWNATKSYRKAYGFSDDKDKDNTCGVNGFRLLRTTKIKQYIDFIKTDYEKEAGISKLKQLKELAKIAYSNISEIHETWIELKDWEHIKQQNPDIMAAVESIDTKIETKVYNKGGDTETDVEIKSVKVKFHPKLPAIAEINKMQGYNEAEKHDHTHKIEGITFE